MSSDAASPDDEEFVLYPSKDEHIKDLEKQVKNLRTFAIVLGVLAFLAFAAVVGLLVNFSISEDTPDSLEGPLYCNDYPKEFKGPKNYLGDPAHPGVFHGLTAGEIRRVRDFLEEEINMTRPNENSTLRDARVFSMDLELPKKYDVINYLDHGGKKPDRHARVMLFRGDLDPPVVQEHVCGPLHNVSSCTLARSVPFSDRPVEFREYMYYDEHLTKEIHRQFGDIIRESFGGSIDFENCEDCLNYWTVPIGSNLLDETPYRRRVWFWLRYDVAYYQQFPIDMAFLVDVDGVDETAFKVEKVWYNGNLYDSPQVFLSIYNNGNIPKITTSYPKTEEQQRHGSMESRSGEEEMSHRHQRPPQLIEPDGRRYTIHHDKIDYMGIWSFHHRMKPLSGPGVYDVRFKGERIAYEISLQDILVQYSGFAPMPRHSFLVESGWGLGFGSKALVAGGDCPTTATFMKFTTADQDNYEPKTYYMSTCVFENNFGKPLRRHHSYSSDDGSFYGGMLDSALVVRSILVVDNADYVIDFTFHQNGAVGVSISLTGYVLTSWYMDGESPYGFQIVDNILGPLTLQAAHLKVDLDINNGTSNRYATLDIEEETVNLRMGSRQKSQTKLIPNVVVMEDDALFNYDFGKPKYHIIYDDAAKSKHGVHKAYRINAKQFSPQLTSRGAGDEKAFVWSRHQMAVTKYKDEEQISSSPYNQFNSKNPPVDFSSFIDSDSLADADLVAWVTLAQQNIIHSEDFPVTSTAGAGMSLYLQPFNYFPEDPSMSSPDGIYMALKDSDAPKEGLVMDVPGGSGDVNDPAHQKTCTTKPTNIYASYQRNPSSLFEV